MNFYKDPANNLHALDSADCAYLLPLGCVEVSEAEYAELSAPPPLTTEQIVTQYTATIQQRLDDFFRSRGYDGVLSAATYATSSVPKFATEGQYAVSARDATWAKCYEVLAAVEAGTRTMPTIDELLAELPALVWLT